MPDPPFVSIKLWSAIFYIIFVSTFCLYFVPEVLFIFCFSSISDWQLETFQGLGGQETQMIYQYKRIGNVTLLSQRLLQLAIHWIKWLILPSLTTRDQALYTDVHVLYFNLLLAIYNECICLLQNIRACKLEMRTCRAQFWTCVFKY